jgi:hypothetical protein
MQRGGRWSNTAAVQWAAFGYGKVQVARALLCYLSYTLRLPSIHLHSLASMGGSKLRLKRLASVRTSATMTIAREHVTETVPGELF